MPSLTPAYPGFPMKAIMSAYDRSSGVQSQLNSPNVGVFSRLNSCSYAYTRSFSLQPPHLSCLHVAGLRLCRVRTEVAFSETPSSLIPLPPCRLHRQRRQKATCLSYGRPVLFWCWISWSIVGTLMRTENALTVGTAQSEADQAEPGTKSERGNARAANVQ